MAAGRGMGSSGTPKSGEVYFELVRVGSYIKMTAVDARTGLEVSIMGPLHATQHDLERVALQKLQSQLAKRGL